MERKIYKVDSDGSQFYFIAPGIEELEASLPHNGISEEDGYENISILELSSEDCDHIYVIPEYQQDGLKSLNQIAAEYGPEHIVTIIACTEE